MLVYMYSVCVCSYLWSADHVFPRYRQRGDVHGDAAIHVERPDQEETATTHDRSADTERATFTRSLLLLG